MCVNKYPITNIYTGKHFYVKCGKCPACLQEKASYRVSRIKNNQSSDTDTLIITLTYDRKSVPFILRDEAYAFAKGITHSLPIYRNSSVRKVRMTSDYDIGYKWTKSVTKIDEIDYISEISFKGNKDLKFQSGKIGVCYYPDIQRFFARLRLNLQRNYNYNEKFSMYICSEYGARSLRPHFHVLLFCRKGDFEVFRSAIAASWPFSDLHNFSRSIEKAFRANSYVASYVNCGSKFPQFLKHYFEPKHSYSKGFGLANNCFQLLEILRKFESGTLSYSVLRNKQGLPRVSSVPIPKYVIHRYFPKFVGYSRISPFTLVSNMERIYNGDISGYNRSVGCSNVVECSRIVFDDNNHIVARYPFRSAQNYPLYLSESDFHKVQVRLKNAYNRFFDSLYKCSKSDLINTYKSFTPGQYFDLHTKIWSLYNSDVLKCHLTNDDIPNEEKYDNLDKVVYDLEHGISPPPGLNVFRNMITDPNKFKSNVVRTRMFKDSYYEHLKHRSVNNVVYSLNNEEM